MIPVVLDRSTTDVAVMDPNSRIRTFNVFTCSLIFLTFTLDITHAQTDYTYQVPEDQSGSFGNVIQDLQLANDFTQVELSTFNYALLSSSTLPIEVDQLSGILRVVGDLDREGLCQGEENCDYQYDLVITQNQAIRARKKLVFTILDENDNKPTFAETAVDRTVRESVPVGYAITDIPTASDPDGPTNSIQGYRLAEDSETFALEVDEPSPQFFTLRLVVKEELNRETRAGYILRIEAFDPSSTGVLTINLAVSDANDNVPVFNATRYEASVPENTPVSTPIMSIHASDLDEGLNGEVRYRLSAQSEAQFGGVFGIREETGELYVKGEVNYEARESYTLVIIAQDRGTDSVPQSVTATVTVLDLNDNPPQVSVIFFNGQNTVDENSPLGTFVAPVSVSDADSGVNAEVTCTLNDNLFALRMSGSDYDLVTAGELDREQMTSGYSLAVVCEDGGSPSLQSVQTVTLVIVDQNDNTPVFSKKVYSISLVENTLPEEPILTVSASDKDVGENADITYTLSANVTTRLSVNPSSGQITVLNPIDRDTTPVLNFAVYATDGGSPPRAGEATVSLEMQDVNDEAPIIPSGQIFNLLEGSSVPANFGPVVAYDSDLNDQVIFSLLSTSGMFTIDSGTGVVTVTGDLDREQQDEYSLVVQVQDSATPPHASSATVQLLVLDTNDHAPEFIYPTVTNWTRAVASSTATGSVVATVVTRDRDAGVNARVVYALEQNSTYFLLNPSSGDIFCMQDLTDQLGQDFDLVIVARDSHPISPLQTRAVLRLTVSEATQPAPVVSSRPRQTAVIAVACVAGVIIVLLILGIVLLIRNRRRRRLRESVKSLKPMVTVVRPPSKEELGDHEQKGQGVGRSVDGRYSYHNSGYSHPDQPWKPQAPDNGELGSVAGVSNADSGRGGSSEEEDSPGYNPYLAPVAQLTHGHAHRHNHPPAPMPHKSPVFSHMDGSRRNLLYRQDTPPKVSTERIYHPDRLNISLPENSIPKANRDSHQGYLTDSGACVGKSASLKEPYPNRFTNLLPQVREQVLDTPSDFAANQSSATDITSYGTEEPFQIPSSQVFIIDGRRLKDVYV